MHPMLRATAVLLSAPLLVLATATTAAAQAEPACGPQAFAELIDETGEYLRGVSARTEPALRRKFQELARARGWPSDEAEDRGYELIQDSKIANYDTRARKLLLELDGIGAVDESTATCEKLERLKTVTRELRIVTEAKVTHVNARLDDVLSPGGASGEKRADAPRTSAQPSTSTTAPAPRPATRAETPPPAAVRPAPKDPGNWRTSTTSNPAVSAAPPTPLAEALPPRAAVPARMTYSSEEISQAGRGLFGSLSAELASVIRYAFDTYGQPNGYILGTEGGGAFLAGLSYGKGRLHTKMGAPSLVYWQGPSVGYDLGLTGSRVMFLVYNLKEPDDIFRRYGGIGGSAYVVGGVGLTFHMRGPIVLAPIRTGLGLRIGANIGYLKFTPERSLNPF